MNETASPQTEWLVIASICDCDRVAITIMDEWAPGTDAADDREATATGADWRLLIPPLARELHRASGLPISGMCTVVHAADDELQQALRTEAVKLVYQVADATEMPTHCTGCTRPLMLRRPGRTHCEACRPTMVDSVVKLHQAAAGHVTARQQP